MVNFINYDQQLGTTSFTETDEIVKTIHDNQSDPGLYAGYIYGLTDDRILGSSDSVFGVFSAVARGGTRYTVIKEGTPTSGQVLLDQATGRIVSTAALTLYVTYPFYARLWRWWERGAIQIQTNENLSLNADITVFEKVFVYPERFVGLYWRNPILVDAAPTFTIKKNNVTVFTTSSPVIDADQLGGYIPFSTFLKFAANDKLDLIVNYTDSGILATLFDTYFEIVRG